MKREEVEKAAKYLGELVTPEIRHSETVKFTIQQINAALSEAETAVENDNCDQTEYQCGLIDRVGSVIRALKIQP